MRAERSAAAPEFPGKSWVGPRDWLRALGALQAIAADPRRTDRVGEFIGTLTGPSAIELFERVWQDPVGRRLLEEGRDLRATLADRDALGALPEGTLGRAYVDWTAARDLSADGIAEAIHEQVPRDFEGPAATFAARVVDMHDLWHVVNGWDSDLYGEIHLLGYSYAQLGAWAWFLLGGIVSLLLAGAGRFESIGYLKAAVGRGRRATLLAAVDWEAMLPLPLEEVRRRLRIDAPVPYEKLPMGEELERIRRAPPLSWLLGALPGADSGQSQRRPPQP